METAHSSALAGVYAVAGSSRFLRDLALRDLLSGCGVTLEELEPTRFDGASASLAEVLDEVRTLSLLGDRRLVIVDEADRFITANRKSLERYCSDPAPSGTLVLLCNSLPRNTKLHRIIQAHGAVATCEAPKGRALVGWIVDRAGRSYNKRMDQRAAQRLHELIGDEPGLLDAELAKLSAYVGDRASITERDVLTLTGHLREEKVFSVTDAMAVGDTAGAIAQWEQVLATDRAAPARAIAGLAWAVRRLLEARRAYDGGATPHELSRMLFTDPKTARRRLESVRTAELEAQQRDLLAADLAIKTGASTIDVAVERFIVKHTARQRAAACS